MIFTGSQRLTGPVIGLVASLSVFAAFSFAQPRSGVTFSDGLLSIQFRDAPLRHVFEELKDRAGIAVRAAEPIRSRRVTVDLRGMPIDKGVRELLRQASLESHAVVYGSGAEPRMTLFVVESGGKSTAPPEPPIPEAGQADDVAAPDAAHSEPIYVPPAAEPVYVPPAEEPVYIPPAEEPAYIPPESEPEPVPEPHGSVVTESAG